MNIIAKAGGKILNGKDGVELCSDMLSFLIPPETLKPELLERLNHRIAKAKAKALDCFDLSEYKN
ncbi:hypothetical protein ACPV5V_19310 [Vibrio campbellii]